jgi:isocitrate dehydrogenase (NAD+)
MLAHLGQAENAARLRKAITDTMASGDRVTPDLGGNGKTAEFADAIIDRINADG